jgi:hypothetical protein
MDAFLADVRYGLRLLRKSPGFSAVAVLTLALGIGANTAIFSVIDALLIRPLPYANPDRVVMVWEDAWQAGFHRNTPAPGNYNDWVRLNRSFSDIAATRGSTVNSSACPFNLDDKAHGSARVSQYSGRRFACAIASTSTCS